MNLRGIARIGWFLGVTPTLLGAYAAHDAIAGGHEPALRDRWVGRWCDAILRGFGLTLIMVDGDRREHDRGRLVVSNHRGVADIVVLWRTFGGRMVSRADLSSWPLIGLAGRRLGTVFVDRSKASSGASTIRTVRTLLQQGETVVMFPEGTTYGGDEVRPFQAGGISAVLGTGASIVPAGLAYSRGSQAEFLDESFPQHLGRMASAPPSRVAVAVGPPLEVPEGARAAQLAETCRQAVAAQVARARATVDAA